MNGGENMCRRGGLVTDVGRLRTVPPAAFHRADFHPVEGVVGLRFGQCLIDQGKCQSHEGRDIEPARTDETPRAQLSTRTPATGGPGRRDPGGE